MQLKMSKPFNAKLVKQMLQEENKFITDLFSKVPLPVRELDEPTKSEQKTSQKGKAFTTADGNKMRAGSFTQLHAKLEALKNVKKLDYKEKLLKKNIKNRIKKKSKREERLLQKKLARTEQHSASLNKTSTDNGDVPKIPKPKPVYNSEGKMVFSKFDFSEIGTRKRPMKHEKDPKKLLQQLYDKKEKLKQLKEIGENEKADEMMEKDAWKNALAKSSGEKVKDDPDLLKRTIKRQDQKKKRSTQKWDSRIEHTEKTKQDRQDKRQENIAKRKKDKKVNKLKRATKKGRVIPGF